MQINIVDGYAVYSIKDTDAQSKKGEEKLADSAAPDVLSLGPSNAGGTLI